jgi:hypothetical protein
MVYEFNTLFEGTWHGFAVFFRYSQDETRLSVIGIGHIAYGVDR